jgi:hypothetical protein
VTAAVRSCVSIAFARDQSRREQSATIAHQYEEVELEPVDSDTFIRSFDTRLASRLHAADSTPGGSGAA